MFSKKSILSRLALAACLCGCLSCSSKEEVGNDDNGVDTPDVPEVVSSDSVEVRLKAIGDFTASPLSKAGGSSDLYALQVCQHFVSDAGFSSYTNYAAGVFDDLSHAVIKLSKKYKYSFTLAYIPDGKNVIEKIGGNSYGNPCTVLPNGSPDLEVNELRYDTDTYLWMLGTGSSQMKGITDWHVQYNCWNTVCRYQGYTADFDPNASSEVTIELYRQAIGFKIIVDDFTEGEVTLSGLYGHTYSIKPSSSSSTNILQVAIEPEALPTAYGSSNVSTVGFLSYVKIFYYDGENQIQLLIRQLFPIERNTLYTLRFSLSDAIANGGITANVIEEGEMKEVQMEF